jgi:GNAT superfamily N-acetyltransferase
VESHHESPLFTVSAAPNAEQLAEGARVVVVAQKATGLPDRRVWPPDLLLEHTKRRQQNALRVWVATSGDVVVGHCLLERVPADDAGWLRAGNPQVLRALHRGELLQFGAAATHPDWMNKGVQRALMRNQASWLREHPRALVGGASWRQSPGSQAMARHQGTLVVYLPDIELDLYIISPTRNQ